MIRDLREARRDEVADGKRRAYNARKRDEYVRRRAARAGQLDASPAVTCLGCGRCWGPSDMPPPRAEGRERAAIIDLTHAAVTRLAATAPLAPAACDHGQHALEVIVAGVRDTRRRVLARDASVRARGARAVRVSYTRCTRCGAERPPGLRRAGRYTCGACRRSGPRDR